MMTIMRYLHTCIEFADGQNTPGFRTDGPCEIHNNGAVYFSQIDANSYNRRNGPALITPNGYLRFHDEEGDTSRLNGPAVIWSDGNKEYWIDGQLTLAEEFFLKYGVL